MMEKIVLPSVDDSLYPYEIPYLMAYKKLVKEIDLMSQEAEQNNS